MRRAIVGIPTAGLLAFVSTASAVPHAAPTKQANAGDSISQGFGANGLPFDQPSLSWVQGTDDRVGSVFERYVSTQGAFTQEPESVSGAEMVGGDDNVAAQASRICAQTPAPTRVALLLGGNDVCNRPRSSSADAAANLYSVATWTNALRAGLDQLAACLPPGSVVQVLSMPRVDYLYDAGRAKSAWCSWVVWPLANVCRVVTAEASAARRAQIGARIDAYNDALAGEVHAYGTSSNGRNPRGVAFLTDWAGRISVGHERSSVGTYRFGAGDINGVDCFHPNITGQARIACLAWGKGPEGSGAIQGCFAQ